MTLRTRYLGLWPTCLEVPKIAYAISVANAVYRPYSRGTPAMVAYPRLCGTSSAHTENAARASRVSHFLGYPGSQPRIGR